VQHISSQISTKSDNPRLTFLQINHFHFSI